MQKKLRKPAALLLGFALIILILIFSEIFYRIGESLSLIPKQSRSTYMYSDDLYREELGKSPRRTDWPLETRVTPPLASTANSRDRFAEIRIVLSGPYTVPDAKIGYRPKPGATISASRRTTSGVSIFTADYLIDDFGRRKTGIDIDTSKPPALFLGCSVTFGQGVDGSETLAAAFHRANSSWSPSIYALPGWGPAHLLKYVQTPEFTESLLPISARNREEGFSIYTYIDHHAVRVVGGSDMIQSQNWINSIPYFEIKNDELVGKGLFGTANPLTIELYRTYYQLLRASHLAQAMLPHLPVIDGKALDLVAALIERTQFEIQARTRISRFYVMMFPGSYSAKWLKPRLEKKNIAVLDYSQLPLSKYVEQVQIPGDGHPTAAAYEAVGKVLAFDLFSLLQSTPRRED